MIHGAFNRLVAAQGEGLVRREKQHITRLELKTGKVGVQTPLPPAHPYDGESTQPMDFVQTIGAYRLYAKGYLVIPMIAQSTRRGMQCLYHLTDFWSSDVVRMSRITRPFTLNPLCDKAKNSTSATLV